MNTKQVKVVTQNPIETDAEGRKVRVLKGQDNSVKHNGVRYKPGEVIPVRVEDVAPEYREKVRERGVKENLTKEQRERLLKRGVVVEA